MSGVTAEITSPDPAQAKAKEEESNVTDCCRRPMPEPGHVPFMPAAPADKRVCSQDGQWWPCDAWRAYLAPAAALSGRDVEEFVQDAAAVWLAFQAPRTSEAT
jgi:hypothetical protein